VEQSATPRRQELRQVLRDLLDLQIKGGFTGDNLLLLLGLVNCFGVIELLRHRQGAEEGSLWERVINSLIANPEQSSENPEAKTGFRAGSTSNSLKNFLSRTM